MTAPLPVVIQTLTGSHVASCCPALTAAPDLDAETAADVLVAHLAEHHAMTVRPDRLRYAIQEPCTSTAPLDHICCPECGGHRYTVAYILQAGEPT